MNQNSLNIKKSNSFLNTIENKKLNFELTKNLKVATPNKLCENGSFSQHELSPLIKDYKEPQSARYKMRPRMKLSFYVD